MSGCDWQSGLLSVSLRVHVPNIRVLRLLAVVFIVQVLDKYMITRYLDPKGIPQQYVNAHDEEAFKDSSSL